MSLDNPQLEDGFTPVANPIMDALARTQLSGYEWRVLLFLLRKTYGWSKKSDIISLSQFEDGTGLDRRHVARTIKRLIEKRIVFITCANLGTSKLSTYTFNKRFGEWLGSAKLGTTSANLGTRGSANLGTRGSAKNGTHNIKSLQKKSLTTTIAPNQKSKGKGKTPVITWDVSSLQFSGIDDATRARLALAYPNADVDRCIDVMRGWLIKRGDNPHKSYWKSLCSIAEDPQNQKKGLGIEQDFYGVKYRISYDSQSEPLFEVPKKRKHPAVPVAIANALEKVSADDDD